MNLRKVYEYALQREREGKAFFQTNAAKMSHGAAVGIFNKLADEEDKHIAYIQKLMSRLDSGVTDAKPDETITQQGFFSQRAESEALDQTVIESMVPDVTILRMAYLIERDFAEFYEMAASKAEGEAKAALTSLAAWERGHERLFKGLHDKVYQEYMEMPWGG
jgi:rubrerythrin